MQKSIKTCRCLSGSDESSLGKSDKRALCCGDDRLSISIRTAGSSIEKKFLCPTCLSAVRHVLRVIEYIQVETEASPRYPGNPRHARNSTSWTTSSANVSLLTIE